MESGLRIKVGGCRVDIGGRQEQLNMKRDTMNTMTDILQGTIKPMLVLGAAWGVCALMLRLHEALMGQIGG